MFVDPWADASMYGPRGTFFPLWTSAMRLYLIGLGVVLLGVLFGLPLSPSGIAMRIAGFAVVLGVACYLWTRPTWGRVAYGPHDVSAGMVYWGHRSRDTSEVQTLKDYARTIAAVYGPDRYGQLWLAFADGQSDVVPDGHIVEVVEASDFFNRRPMHQIAPPPVPQIQANDFELAALLSNANQRGGSRASLAQLTAMLPSHPPTEAALVRLEDLGLADRMKRSRPPTFRITRAGTIHMMSRAVGDFDPGEPLTTVTDRQGVFVSVHNENGQLQINFDSPGAVQQRDNGVAHVTTMDPSVIDLLRELLSARERIVAGLPSSEARVVADDLQELHDALAADPGDESRLKRLALRVLVVGADVVKGAIGSGVWTGIAAWAGLSS
ncbi:hypothetical protein GCM10017714_12830 [Curtobacterium pusillum]|nr:hypothetical protein GCM10017610_08290 [Curtobacterium pusillum]